MPDSSLQLLITWMFLFSILMVWRDDFIFDSPTSLRGIRILIRIKKSLSYCIFLLSFAWPQIPSTGNLLLRLSVSEQNCGIRFLEHVQVKVDLSFPRRGNLEMSSVSPSGTQSQLLYPRVMDSFFGYKNLKNWTVTSLHYWGENPAGNWSITIRNTKPRRNDRKGTYKFNVQFNSSKICSHSTGFVWWCFLKDGPLFGGGRNSEC